MEKNIYGYNVDNTPKSVFEYSVDEKKRYGDPFVIDYTLRKVMLDNDVDFDECLKTLYNPQTHILTWYGMMGKASPAICAAFNVSQHNPETNEGYTLAQLYNLMESFHVWQNNVKKNTETYQSGSQSGDSLPQAQTEQSSGTNSIGNSITEPASTTNATA